LLNLEKASASVETLPTTENPFFCVIFNNAATMEKDEKPTPEAPVKRGGRFYGTFAKFALLDFICAIDTIILALALPVRHWPHIPDLPVMILTIFADHRYGSEKHCHTSIWVGTSLLFYLIFGGRFTHKVLTITDAICDCE
jgi:hypothetical protein